MLLLLVSGRVNFFLADTDTMYLDILIPFTFGGSIFVFFFPSKFSHPLGFHPTGEPQLKQGLRKTLEAEKLADPWVFMNGMTCFLEPLEMVQNIMAGQPTPPNVPPNKPLIRPYFWGGYVRGGVG